MNKIASKKLVIVALMLILLVSALSACVVTADLPTFKSLTVEQNGKPVQKITIVEGSKIDYASFTLRLTMTDGTTSTAVMTEAVFLPDEIADLYKLSGGNSKGMTILYIADGLVARGLISVQVQVIEVVKETFNVFFFMEPDFAELVKFEDQTGVEELRSLPPTTHRNLKEYQKIVWYTSTDTANPNNLLENKLPLQLTEDLSLYGVVKDDRSYIIRFWKDAKMTAKIGNDVQASYGQSLGVPSGNAITLEGYDFKNNWTYNNTQILLDGTAPNQTFKVNFDATSYPKAQVIDLIGVYQLKSYRVALYERTDIKLPDGTIQRGEENPILLNGKDNLTAKHNDLLQFGTEFNIVNNVVTLPKPPLKTGYSALWYLSYVSGEETVTTVFSENQGARPIVTSLSLIAVYIQNEYTVSFYKYGSEVASKSVNISHGSVLQPTDILELSTVDIDRYEYSWDLQSSLALPVTGNIQVREIRTPKNFAYRFVMSDGTELFSGENAYDQIVNLPSKESIKDKLISLGKDWFLYFDYGWYSSIGGSRVDTEIKQPVGTLTLYLGYEDTRRYTVNYYYQKSGSQTVESRNILFSVTVKFGETVRYDGSQALIVTGWEPKSIYSASLQGGLVSAADVKIIDGIEFVPSTYIQNTYTMPEIIDIVMMYERRIYTVTLNENFGGQQSTYYDTTKVSFETMIGAIDKISNYDKTDRTKNNEVYRFYGWADGSGQLVEDAKTVSGDMTLTAQWISLSEGSFGLKYEISGTGSNRYATLIGYSGVSAELIIGSRYYDENARDYVIVKKINWINTAPNQVVTKIKLPDTVETIQQGAFGQFYALQEIEISSAAPNFATENGVLYNKQKTELMLYPIKKSDQTFTIPTSVIKIVNSAMVGFRGEILLLSTAITEIGENALSFASALTSIILPDGLKVIAANAFSGSKKLQTVTYNGSSLTEIGNNAFADTAFLQQKTNGMVVLGGKYIIRAYYGISTQLTLDNAILGIASGAFAASNDGGVQKDTGLKLLNILSGSNLQFIGDGALQCLELIAVNVASRTTVILLGSGVFDGTVSAFRIMTDDQNTLDLFNTKYTDTEYESLFAIGTASVI